MPKVQALLTRSDHPTGSDRLAEACEQLGLDGQEIVVNVHGTVDVKDFMLQNPDRLVLDVVGARLSGLCGRRCRCAGEGPRGCRASR